MGRNRRTLAWVLRWAIQRTTDDRARYHLRHALQYVEVTRAEREPEP